MAGLAGAERIDARLRALYGEVPGEVGVLHVASVWRDPAGGLRVLRIGPHTPRSPTDAFALSLARARVDAIVTTGRILRFEPGLTHALVGPEALCNDLRAWRAERVGHRNAARSAVLTSARELDLDHPLLRAALRPLVITTPAAAARLAHAVAARDIEVIGLDPLDARSALAALRARGMRSIAIEAGPATALALYSAPLAIDELMLSICESSALPEGVAGPPFLSPARLAELLPRASRGAREGEWFFERRSR